MEKIWKTNCQIWSCSNILDEPPCGSLKSCIGTIRHNMICVEWICNWSTTTSVPSTSAKPDHVHHSHTFIWSILLTFVVTMILISLYLFWRKKMRQRRNETNDEGK